MKVGDQKLRVGIAVAAVVLIAIGVLTNSWWTFEQSGFELRIGLRKVGVCGMGQCIEASYGSSNMGTGTAFRFFAFLTHWGGLLAAGGLALGVLLRENTGNEAVARSAGSACAFISVSALLTVWTFPDMPEMSLPGGGSFGLSLSYGFYFTLIGGLAGAVAGWAGFLAGSMWEGRTYVPVGGEESRPARRPGGAASAAAPANVNRQELSQMAADAASVPHTDPRTRNPKQASQRIGDVAAAPTDALRGSLRFVARSCEISKVGLSVVLESGQQRDVLWSDVGAIAARTLPPDPPFEKTTIVDIVPRPVPGTQLTPIRLLPSTRANYGALPGGAGMSSKENFRKLAAFLEQQKPGVIEGASNAFFKQEAAAPLFQSVKQFTDYDRQFGE
jgi:hypothetical protein